MSGLVRIFPAASVITARTFATAAKPSWISCNVERSRKSVRRRVGEVGVGGVLK